MSIYSKLKGLHRRFRKLWKKTNSIYFVTGADSSHFRSLLQFLGNLQLTLVSDKRFKVIAWDLGLEKEQIELINKQFKGFVSLQRFPFEKYPDWLKRAFSTMDEMVGSIRIAKRNDDGKPDPFVLEPVAPAPLPIREMKRNSNYRQKSRPEPGH